MSSSISFALKRKAPETLPPASTAFSDATTTKKARADTDADTIEGILSVEGGSVLGSFDAEKTKAPLVIPLKLVNEEPGSRPSPAPSTESTASLASILSARAGTKWGLQLRAPSSSLAASPLTNSSENDALNKDNEPDTHPRTKGYRRSFECINLLPLLNYPKEKYLYDLSLRPEEATLEDFEQVPIEDFGIAMLRGMGYKDEVEDEKKKNKKDFVFSKPRPNLLGLGAEPPKSLLGIPRGVQEILGNRKDGYVGSKSDRDRNASSSSSSSNSMLEKYGGKRTGSILSCRIKTDGIALKIGIGKDEMRCWTEDVSLI
ncbi:hypothetical protein BCR33DRAFT_715497 [Rhizoclosmatium globosum]|uniref:Spp2/MOS2 G-patch domain-containing protein n=1 Tax=Rhizoclosmatium globosum TaxID=329046 RepID=A0A1Y2CH93_9FUNG|nr:hypothetical protein BCR33DRAFT_715497 [Rhizoclosmatium globosum]|eukprot:ORY46399.1 hypothetical protein BCR33DRAFT_715497 [Rhizoclosmatium globosum]